MRASTPRFYRAVTSSYYILLPRYPRYSSSARIFRGPVAGQDGGPILSFDDATSRHYVNLILRGARRKYFRAGVCKFFDRKRN